MTFNIDTLMIPISMGANNIIGKNISNPKIRINASISIMVIVYPKCLVDIKKEFFNVTVTLSSNLAIYGKTYNITEHTRNNSR